MEKRRKRGPRARIPIACVVLLALGGGMGTVMALNWTRVSGLYHQFVSTFADVRCVQTALQAKYHTGAVAVQVKRVSRIPGPILSVNFINAQFLNDPANAKSSPGPTALEVATAARDALSPQREYDNYEVSFTHQRRVGITISTSEVFWFRAGELPPRKTKGNECENQ